MTEKLNRAMSLAMEGMSELGAGRTVVSSENDRGQVVGIVTESDRAKALVELCHQWDQEDEENGD